MREPKPNLALSIESLKRLQSSLLAAAVGIVQPAEEVSIAFAVDYGRSVEVGEDLDWILNG